MAYICYIPFISFKILFFYPVRLYVMHYFVNEVTVLWRLSMICTICKIMVDWVGFFAAKLLVMLDEMDSREWCCGSYKKIFVLIQEFLNWKR